MKPEQFTEYLKPFPELKDKWFACTDDGQYIHQDGIDRETTCYKGMFTGYFETEEEAFAAIKKYKQEQIKKFVEINIDELNNILCSMPKEYRTEKELYSIAEQFMTLLDMKL